MADCQPAGRGEWRLRECDGFRKTRCLVRTVHGGRVSPHSKPGGCSRHLIKRRQSEIRSRGVDRSSTFDGLHSDRNLGAGRMDWLAEDEAMRWIPNNFHRILDLTTVAVFALVPSLFGLAGFSAILSYTLAIVHLAM